MSKDAAHSSKNRTSTLSARLEALECFRDITDRGAYLNLRLKHIRQVLNDRDAAFVTALVHTALDRLYYIDSILADVTERKPQPVIQAILRLALTELLFMRTPVYAVADSYTELTRAIRKNALSGFVNGVIRSVERKKETLPAFEEDNIHSISVRYSCPEWIVSMWIEDYGLERTKSLLQCSGFPLTVRAQYPFTTDDLLSDLPVSGTIGSMDPNAILLEKGFDITGSDLYRHGKIAIQSEGAMLLARAIGDPKRLKILDACAAPGGKSAYLASLAKNDLQLTAWELHEHRMALMRCGFDRLKVPAVCSQMDASVPHPEYSNSFDAVLLDVPCSGLGLIHDKPDIRYNKKEEDIDKLSKVQRNILFSCADYVIPGGILVYATCTISKKENENNVKTFLHERTDFRPDPLPFNESCMLQLFPDIHGTEGFFVARMKRCI